MKEHPIIFSTDMVKAILDGRKTMTRRVIKPQPIKDASYLGGWAYKTKRQTTSLLSINEHRYLDVGCPYGQVSDRLWVRETWAAEKRYDHLKPSEIPDTAKIYYVDKLIHLAGGYSLFVELGKVRSSMFMCRWMSRITLEITELRVERLQEIKAEEVVREGCQLTGEIFLSPQEECPVLIDKFRRLWDSLNAQRGYDWEVNPWCWCISFKVVDK